MKPWLQPRPRDLFLKACLIDLKHCQLDMNAGEGWGSGSSPGPGGVFQLIRLVLNMTASCLQERDEALAAAQLRCRQLQELGKAGRAPGERQGEGEGGEQGVGVAAAGEAGGKAVKGVSSPPPAGPAVVPHLNARMRPQSEQE